MRIAKAIQENSMSINFPDIDPILIHIGPLPIRWYSLAYIAGILIGIQYIKYLSKKSNYSLPKDFFDNFLIFVILGIIIGGRLGYVMIYDPLSYIEDPIKIFKTWTGGMSFHGGLIGFIVSTIIFSKRYKLNHWKIFDMAACAAPIGIFFGRIANFINGELVGRTTDLPWGVVFPGNIIARHPSQLYEALAEGLVLFILMNILFINYKFSKRERTLSGLFCIFYSAGRFFIEFFREPDSSVGYILEYFTMGQVISLLMILVGVYIIKFDPLKKITS